MIKKVYDDWIRTRVFWVKMCHNHLPINSYLVHWAKDSKGWQLTLMVFRRITTYRLLYILKLFKARNDVMSLQKATFLFLTSKSYTILPVPFSIRLCHGVVTRLGYLSTLGNFLKTLARINLPKSPTFLCNFCKGVKIFKFSSEIILGKFYRHLATFYGCRRHRVVSWAVKPVYEQFVTHKSSIRIRWIRSQRNHAKYRTFLNNIVRKNNLE